MDIYGVYNNNNNNNNNNNVNVDIKYATQRYRKQRTNIVKYSFVNRTIKN
jgi:hypothetical protein